MRGGEGAISFRKRASYFEGNCGRGRPTQETASSYFSSSTKVELTGVTLTGVTHQIFGDLAGLSATFYQNAQYNTTDGGERRGSQKTQMEYEQRQILNHGTPSDWSLKR